MWRDINHYDDWLAYSHRVNRGEVTMPDAEIECFAHHGDALFKQKHHPPAPPGPRRRAKQKTSEPIKELPSPEIVAQYLAKRCGQPGLAADFAAVLEINLGEGLAVGIRLARNKVAMAYFAKSRMPLQYLKTMLTNAGVDISRAV